MSSDLEIALSDKTFVFVNLTSKKLQQPYCGFKRTRPDDASYKRLFYMSLPNMLTLLDNIPKLNGLTELKDARKVEITLDHNKSVAATTFNSKKYITLLKKGTQIAPYMNLDLAEFTKLSESSRQIRAFVQDLLTEKVLAQPTHVPRDITLYSWMYIDSASGRKLKTSSHWFLDEFQARADGTDHGNSLELTTYGFSQRAELFTFDSQFSLPDNETLALKAYIFAVKKVIESMKTGHCEACLDNLAYSCSEHDLGCGMPFSTAVDVFYQQHLMDSSDLADMVLRIIQTLNDRLPESQRQGLLREKLSKTAWPSPVEVNHYQEVIGDDLLHVFEAVDHMLTNSTI